MRVLSGGERRTSEIINDLTGGIKPLFRYFQMPRQVPRLAGDFEAGRVVHQKVQTENDEPVVAEGSWQFQKLANNEKRRRKKAMTAIIKS